MVRKGTPTTAIIHRPETAPARWSSFNAVDDMHRQLDEMFGNLFGYTPLSRLIPNENLRFEPTVDIYETDDRLRMYCAIPGVAPELIHVELTADTVTIQGERKPLYEDEKAIVHRNGGVASSATFSMAYTMPVEIDPARIVATFRNGVLELEMPKAEYARPRGVKVEIAAK